MAADLEDDELAPLPYRPDQIARIARPETSPIPPVALRGISAPRASAEGGKANEGASPSLIGAGAQPEMGSTGDLEMRGLATRTMPRPIAQPSPLEARTTGDQAELERLNQTGSGISQIARAHPVAGGILRGLNVAGDVAGAILPQARLALRAIPGTEEHHQLLQKQATGRIGEDLGEQQKEAVNEETGARTEQAQAAAENQRSEAYAREHPQAKQGLTPEETTIHDLMTGENGQPRLNPETQKPYTYLEAYQATKQAGQDVKPTPEKKTNDVVRIVNGVPHMIKVDAATGQDVRDLGPTKIPQDTSGKTNERADKSYTYNNNKLDQLGKPIEDAVGRMGRLRDTLAQGTPQADALVAPELLTIMAGGMGSGLRMNEAEISRIVGGRSKWQSLEASINQWRADPTKANSITPEQRQQIHALVDGVNAKLQLKQKALDDAREKLLDSDDPKEHRRIVTDAHHALSQVDEGTAQAAGGNQGAVEYKAGLVRNGYKFKGGDPTDKNNWEAVTAVKK